MNASLSRDRRGFSLLELLVCIAVIAILVSLSTGPVMRGLARAKKLQFDTETPTILQELRQKVGTYCAQNAAFKDLTLAQILDRCSISSKARGLLTTQGAEFISFSASDPLDKIVFKYARNGRSLTLRKEDFTLPEESPEL